MKKRLSLGFTINLMFLSLVLSMLVIAVAGYVVSNNAASAGDELYRSYGKTQGDASMAFANLQDAKAHLRNVLFLYADDAAKQQESIEALANSKKTMVEFVDKAKENLLDSTSLKLLAESEEAALKYFDTADTCVDYAKANKMAEAKNELANVAVPAANEAKEKMEAMLEQLDKRANEKVETVKGSAMVGTIVILVLIIVGIGIAVFAISYMSRKVRAVIVELAAAAENLGRGEIIIDVPKDHSIKEIYELLGSFQTLIQNLRRQADALMEFANGNLRVDYKPSSDTDVVGNAIVQLLEGNNAVLNDIRTATNQINLGSGQIAAVSQTLAQGSTQQASAIQQITASITDIANKTKRNAEQSDEVLRIVMQAKEDVVNGNKRMEEMVHAMKEINEASENIHKVIKVIDDIAFNTNILALNATVEAARAGDQGKGFAVVAEEVRNLAGRSAEASGQTAEMIEDAIAKAKVGEELAKQTEESLNVISDMIDHIAELSGNIATTSNDQATATSQIDQALTQVSQVVQTNSATSEECASASEQLSGQARGLNHEIEKFQLKDIVGGMSSRALGYEEAPMLEGDNFMY